MSDFGEAIGSAVEGGLTSRAVEKETGAGSGGQPAPLHKGHFAEGDCLNCGTKLIGSHCHQCGQKAHLHRTIGAFFHDLMHGALHLEGKMWSTLPLLIFKPGKLTRRYIDGERAKFVSPMAIFLFGVFLMFAVFQALGLTAPSDIEGAADDAISTAIEQERETLLQEKAQLQAELEAASDEATRARLLEGIAERDEELQKADTAKTLIAFDSSVANVDRATALGELVGGDAAGEPKDQVADAATQATGPGTSTDGDERPPVEHSEGETGIGWLDRGVAKWRDNPSLMVYKLQANSYKFSWLLIPLSVPFMWLLFAWKRQFKLYDHAIFVTYSLAFMTLLFIAVSLIGAAGLPTPLVVFSLLLIPPFHIYKQLRSTYRLSRFGALWRLVILTFCVAAVLILFVQILLLLGAF